MAVTLRGGLPALLFAVGVLAGALALLLTPREEEPQIVVPMIDVLVEAPGLSARQTERQVTIPLEKLLAQIPGVEHVYSTTDAGETSVTLRFYVGEDREDSLLKIRRRLIDITHTEGADPGPRPLERRPGALQRLRAATHRR